MARFNLKQIKLHVPEYGTDATIVVNEAHSSGMPHLETVYDKEPPHGHKSVAVAIPDDWTDQDLAELIFIKMQAHPTRNWPAWEIPAMDHGAFRLYRFWKGEQPPKD
ncbi:hypothetical protein [Bradyrhizobium sp. RT9a]|uniref:hypothetical protein n=1 Tax=Bradyrhizobium sp. RT9a TaxID=3156384 RepID=UPI0033941954